MLLEMDKEMAVVIFSLGKEKPDWLEEKDAATQALTGRGEV